MNRLNSILNGFMIGMLFEYMLRVEVSFFPIAISILLTIMIILDFILDYYKKKRDTLLKQIECNLRDILINENNLKKLPKDWIVYQCSQNPINMLWRITLLNIDDYHKDLEDIRQIKVTDEVSYESALKKAISEIKLA